MSGYVLLALLALGSIGAIVAVYRRWRKRPPSDQERDKSQW